MDMTLADIGPDFTCVRLEGRLDAAGADQIGVRFTASVASIGKPAAIDLSGVSFLASMGMRLLISTARALDAKGSKMALFGAQEGVQNALEQAAFDQLMALVSTEQQALDALRG
jgi:anti-anti-sigma factor